MNMIRKRIKIIIIIKIMIFLKSIFKIIFESQLHNLKLCKQKPQ